MGVAQVSSDLYRGYMDYITEHHEQDFSEVPESTKDFVNRR